MSDISSIKVGFVGFGNMGSAIYYRLIKQGIKQENIAVYDKDLEKLKKAEINSVSLDIEKTFDYIVIAVKPKDIKSLKMNWKGTIVSIAAGVNMRALKDVFKSFEVVRLMPNTPLLVGEGISGVFFTKKAQSSFKEDVKSFLELFTKIVVVEKEELMDAITAISGSGPAFAYQFIEALADAAVRLGLGRADSYLLASQMLLGSAKMVLETNEHPAVLKDMVTSPAGTTIEGLAVLEENGFRSAIIEAATAAFDRAQEMGD